jgi:hypothetical protein
MEQEGPHYQPQDKGLALRPMFTPCAKRSTIPLMPAATRPRKIVADRRTTDQGGQLKVKFHSRSSAAPFMAMPHCNAWRGGRTCREHYRLFLLNFFK